MHTRKPSELTAVAHEAQLEGPFWVLTMTVMRATYGAGGLLDITPGAASRQEGSLPPPRCALLLSQSQSELFESSTCGDRAITSKSVNCAENRRSSLPDQPSIAVEVADFLPKAGDGYQS